MRGDSNLCGRDLGTRAGIRAKGIAMDTREAQRLAHQMRLVRLEEKQLGQLARSIETARELAQKLPSDLHWSEEPCVVFSLPYPGKETP